MHGSGNKRFRDGTVKTRGNRGRGNARGGGRGKRGPLLSSQFQSIVSPWENGMTPMGPSNNFSPQDMQQSPDMFRNDCNRNMGPYQMNMGNFGGNFQMGGRMGDFDDNRGNSLLPSPVGGSLLGNSPSNMAFPPALNSSRLQQRLGAPWKPNNNNISSRGSGGGYYPRGRGGGITRKFNKPQRSLSKSTQLSRNKLDNEKSNKVKPSGTSNSKESSVQKDESAQPNSGSESENVEKKKPKVDGAQEEKSGEKVAAPEYPLEALYCHICDVSNFLTKRGFIRHLQGVTHNKMSELYHAKNAAALELLNVSAKLSELRTKDKTLRSTGKKTMNAIKTTEHKLVQQMLSAGFCCGKKFHSPFEIEEHRLDMSHLKRVYLEKKAKEEKESPDEEKEKDIDALIMEATKKQEESPSLTTDSLAPYDPSVMTGLNFVCKVPKYRCVMCKEERIFNSVQMHCQSLSHFENIVSFLTKEEESKKRPSQEEKEKESEEEIKKVSEDNGDDDIQVIETTKKKDDVESDEDVFPIGEDEERILNATDDGDCPNSNEGDDDLGGDIFEEVGDNV